MPTGITCRVYTVLEDGTRVRLADGCLDNDTPILDPIVLDDLKVTWGRETTVDQPAASTCSFKLLDYTGTSFLDLIRLGTRLEIEATYTLEDPPADFNIWPDGGIETNLWTNPRQHVRRLVTAITTAPFPSNQPVWLATKRHTGTYSLAISYDPTNPDHTSWAYIAAVPFVTFGQSTAQWDNLPQVGPGESFPYSFWYCATSDDPDVDIDVGVQKFTSPYGDRSTTVGTGGSLIADGTWRQASSTVSPDPNATQAWWPGLAVRFAPAGGVTAAQSIRIDDIQFGPLPTANYFASVFAGRVTSIKQEYDEGIGAAIITVAGIDFTADLENTIVGDQPWPVQNVTNRFETITALTALPEENSYAIAGTLGKILVSYRDVDAQGAMGLLSEIASSVDGVLWSAIATDYNREFLYLEDPAQRPSTKRLALSGGVVTVVDSDFDAISLSACDMLRDGVEWVQDAQDVTTRVAVTWKEQGTDEDGKPTTTDRTVTNIDTALETDYGQRGLSLSSQLQSSADAANVATKILSRTSGTDWRATGLTIDDAYIDFREPTPDIVLTNYVTDPSAEAGGTGGISWFGPAPAVSDTRAHTGTYSYRFRGPAPGTAVLAGVPDGATTITVSAWYQTSPSNTNPSSCAISIDGSGAVPASTGTFEIVPGDDWIRWTLTTEVIPGGTVYFYPVYEQSTSGYLWVDDLSIGFDVDQPADFNGDTPDTPTYVYAWTGDPYASPSTRTIPGTGGTDLTTFVQTMMAMLNANNRNGLPLAITDMPAWSVGAAQPAVYLEGGEYTFTGGAWILDLNVSSPTALGSSATWNDLEPAWTWNQFDHTLRWVDLNGVDGPTTQTT